jgi:hypothetical protein
MMTRISYERSPKIIPGLWVKVLINPGRTVHNHNWPFMRISTSKSSTCKNNLPSDLESAAFYFISVYSKRDAPGGVCVNWMITRPCATFCLLLSAAKSHS